MLSLEQAAAALLQQDLAGELLIAMAPADEALLRFVDLPQVSTDLRIVARC